MERDLILPVLYDLVVTIGSETSLKSLLIRTLQRLLYHTSYSAGFVCLNSACCDRECKDTEVCIDAAVGDYELVGAVGSMIKLPCDLICGPVQSSSTGSFTILGSDRYQASLRLPIDKDGVIVLLSAQVPMTTLPLVQMLQPVLAHLSKAILLCQSHDEQLNLAAQRQEHTERSLKQSEEIFHSLMQMSPIGVGISCDGVVISVNQVYLNMFGYDSDDQVVGITLMKQIAPQCREDVTRRVALRAQGLSVESMYEMIGLRCDGTEFPVLVSAKRVETNEGPRTLSFFIDLTEQKRNEQALQATNAMLNTVIENAPLRIFWKDKTLRYLGANTSFARDAGREKPAELIGCDDFELSWCAQAEECQSEDMDVIKTNTPRLSVEVPFTTPDGQNRWLRTSKVPLHDTAGGVIGVLGIYDDITEQKNAEEQIHRLAFYDPLTGLPNRRLLYERLQQSFSVSARKVQYGALLFLDMDNFKTINDSRGHDVGDLLLAEVARRLNDCVRDGDTVARLGGDEFVVVLESLSTNSDEAVHQADLVAEKIRERLGVTYEIEKHDFYSTPSIGVVMFMGYQSGIDVLLKHADTAMYQAKAAGRNTIRFYDPLMQAAIEARAELEEDLRMALDAGNFELYYQIQVDSAGQPLGAEALVRWQHPERGMITPAKFIPLAEETGIIIPLGLWVLNAACRQIKSWQSDESTRAITLAVNVCARQFRTPGFVNNVKCAIEEAGIPAELLKLELTESILLENVEDTIIKMQQIKSLGVSFSMDDFGTGYSSLQYLKRLPLDQIKIDQSFVRDIAIDANDAAIVQTIIAMSKVLGLDVIAEGVETEAQYQFLETCGCHAFQGYLFGKPLPISEFEVLLSANHNNATSDLCAGI